MEKKQIGAASHSRSRNTKGRSECCSRGARVAPAPFEAAAFGQAALTRSRSTHHTPRITWIGHMPMEAAPMWSFAVCAICCPVRSYRILHDTGSTCTVQPQRSRPLSQYLLAPTCARFPRSIRAGIPLLTADGAGAARRGHLPRPRSWRRS